MPVATDLQAALALFGPNGEKWVPVDPDQERGTNCALSAIINACCDHHHAAGETYNSRKNAAIAALYRAAGHRHFPKWNDNHTWPEVKAIFEKAIQESSLVCA